MASGPVGEQSFVKRPAAPAAHLLTVYCAFTRVRVFVYTRGTEDVLLSCASLLVSAMQIPFTERSGVHGFLTLFPGTQHLSAASSFCVLIPLLRAQLFAILIFSFPSLFGLCGPSSPVFTSHDSFFKSLVPVNHI